MKINLTNQNIPNQSSNPNQSPQDQTQFSLHSPQPTPEQIQQTAEAWLNFAQNSFVGESLKTTTSQSSRVLTKTQINSMLLNPQLNYELLQNVSQLYMTKSGIYSRLINYFSYLLTFDTLLIPRTGLSTIKNPSKVSKSFEASALYLEMLNPKTNLPIFSKELFINGELFLYKISDNKSIEYKIIPAKYCLVYKKTEGVYRYVIDMQKFTVSEDVTSYPKEIQSAVEKYKVDKSSFIGERYYEVNQKNGVCFTLNRTGGHAIPPFSNIFCDLVNLEENVSLEQKISKLENIKMIHNKIPLNPKDSKPILDPALCKVYNESIKRNLDDGIFSIVNPFESSVLNLNNNAQRTTSLVQSAIDMVYADAGVSDLLFNNQKASGEALKKSVMVDSTLLISSILPMFSDYLTWELGNIDKTMSWKVLTLPFTYDNREETRTKCGNELAFGGSRSLYLASCGFSPLQGLNLLAMEQLIGIDKLFIPAQSSHTTSNTGGAPTNASKGKSISDITDNQNETL